MHITVCKQPDGVAFMTKDGHGDLFAGDVVVGDAPHSFGDNTVELAERASGVVCLFSWVDYLDTSNREVPGVGVRHTVERGVPGSFSAGPYSVLVGDPDPQPVPEALSVYDAPPAVDPVPDLDPTPEG